MLDTFKVHEKLLDYLQSSSTLPCKTRPDLIWGRYDPIESGLSEAKRVGYMGIA